MKLGASIAGTAPELYANGSAAVATLAPPLEIKAISRHQLGLALIRPQEANGG